jgi:transposase
VPRNRGRATTLLAGLTAAGGGPTRTRVGGTTKEVFLAYLREEVVPTLAAGHIPILDNLGAHRAREVREVVEAAGARLVYLPPSSPDLNPIELAFGTLKARLRRAGARTRAAFEAAIGDALAAVTPADIRAFYAHCGYPLPGQP